MRGILGTIIAIALIGMIGYILSNQGTHTAPEAPQGPPARSISIDGIPLTVEVRDTPQGRAEGLSGHAPLGPNEGMLFVFEEDGQYSFWMKDMLFAIDMLWIAHDGTVVHIAHDARPESFPQAFTPDSPARYVLEVASGFAAAHGIVEGSKVAF